MIEQYINISNTSIDSQVENSNQSYTFSISSGSTLTLPDNTIESSGGNFQDTTPAVLPIYVIADVEWTDSDGLTYSTEYGQPIICTPAFDNEVLVNNNLFATSSNGVPINVNVINTDNVNVGSQIGSNFVIGNSIVKINNVTVANIEAEDTANKFVTINGVQVGTWSNPSQTWTINVLQSGTAVGSAVGLDWIIPTAAVPSISIVSSTSSVNFGSTVSFTVSALNFTPNNFTFYSDNNLIGTSSLSTFTWTTNKPFSQSIRCLATDGSLFASDTIGLTVSAARVTSLSMDGVNDWAIGNWQSNQNFTQSESWSFWYKLNVLGGYRTMITTGYTTTAANYNWQLNVNSANFDFRFGEATGVYPYSFTYSNGIWQNIVVARSNNGSSATFCVFRDGVQVVTGSGAVSSGTSATNNFFLGLLGSSRERYLFHGFSHYTGMATLTDAQQLFNNRSPLVVPTTTTGNISLQEYFPFGESAVVPSTNYGTPTIVKGVYGGRMTINQGFASPFGLVTDIP